MGKKAWNSRLCAPRCNTNIASLGSWLKTSGWTCLFLLTEARKADATVLATDQSFPPTTVLGWFGRGNIRWSFCGAGAVVSIRPNTCSDLSRHGPHRTWKVRWPSPSFLVSWLLITCRKMAPLGCFWGGCLPCWRVSSFASNRGWQMSPSDSPLTDKIVVC